MKEQAGLMEEVSWALFICVNSTVVTVSRMVSYLFAALQSQGPSAESGAHAPAAEPEGRRRPGRARRVRVGKRSSCRRQRTGPTASNCDLMVPG